MNATPQHNRLAATVLAALSAVIVAAGAGAVERPGGPARPAIVSGSVTLITGDRVDVRARPDGTASVVLRPGPGRENLAFVQSATDDGDGITVTPVDAVPLLAEGLLDRGLFNVSGLLRQGFGNPGESGLPLIITLSPGSRGGASHLPAAAFAAARGLPGLNAVLVPVDPKAPGKFWSWLTAGDLVAGGRAGEAALARAHSAGIAKVWLDGRARVLLDQSAPQIGVPLARQAGLTGLGVTVAVLDTGIRPDHPDFAGRIVDAKDFTDTRPDASDDFGHGTHVASIIAGSGAASGGRYEGVASSASLINGKVCSATGSCAYSAIIAGMEWAAPRARIVNLSLGGEPTDGTDPLSQAVNFYTTEYGTLFVVAAGNRGAAFAVTSPATADQALAVGSVTKQNSLSSFSSRGPRVGDFGLKPDILAPGSMIVAARASGTPIGDREPVDDYYTRLSGTSMAAPHVTGAAALLAQAHPEWTAAQLKPALMGSALPMFLGIFDQGAGRLDVGRAVSQPVIAVEGSLGFGRALWPFNLPAVTKTVTYSNLGDGAVALTLALSSSGPGVPPPAGLFTVSPSVVTVPAHSVAVANVTFAPSPGVTPGLFGGWLQASDGSTLVRTPFGAYLEPERYDLRIERTGRPGFMAGSAYNLTTGEFTSFFTNSQDYAKVLRLPPGKYQVTAVDFPFSEPPPNDVVRGILITEPEVVLDRDRTVVLDGTLAQRPNVKLDPPSVVSVTERFELIQQHPSIPHTLLGFGRAEIYAVPSRHAPGRRQILRYFPTLAVPGPASNPTAYPLVYDLLFVHMDAIPARLDYRVTDRSLAAVTTDYYQQGAIVPPRQAERANNVVYPGINSIAAGSLVALPSSRIEYFRPGIAWLHQVLAHIDVSGYVESAEASRTYRAGTYRNSWGRAPLGPAIPAPFGAERDRNIVSVRVPLFSSSEPGQLTLTPAQGTTSLSRDGVVLGSSDKQCSGTFTVPERSGATYTLTCSATRNVPWSLLEPRVDVTWTVRDTQPPAARHVPLPLFVMRAAAPVDGNDRVAGGRPHQLQLSVDRRPGKRLKELTLEVSFDDGASWTPAPIARRTLAGWSATVTPPATEGFVSLRIGAIDGAGNSVAQTVLRSYGVAPSE
jgi:subtilisin family serine protease